MIISFDKDIDYISKDISTNESIFCHFILGIYAIKIIKFKRIFHRINYIFQKNQQTLFLPVLSSIQCIHNATFKDFTEARTKIIFKM